MNATSPYRRVMYACFAGFRTAPHDLFGCNCSRRDQEPEETTGTQTGRRKARSVVQ